MSIIKYIFIKRYREEYKKNFSIAFVNRINNTYDELELIYKDIFSKVRTAA